MGRGGARIAYLLDYVAEETTDPRTPRARGDGLVSFLKVGIEGRLLLGAPVLRPLGVLGERLLSDVIIRQIHGGGRRSKNGQKTICRWFPPRLPECLRYRVEVVQSIKGWGSFECCYLDVDYVLGVHSTCGAPGRPTVDGRGAWGSVWCRLGSAVISWLTGNAGPFLNGIHCSGKLTIMCEGTGCV